MVVVISTGTYYIIPVFGNVTKVTLPYMGISRCVIADGIRMVVEGYIIIIVQFTAYTV